jgi:hypothetical protein
MYVCTLPFPTHAPCLHLTSSPLRYCVTYVTDSTLGTLLNIAFLRLFEHQMLKYPHCTSMKFGEYGSPPRLTVWGAQLSVWLAIVIFAKMITLIYE